MTDEERIEQLELEVKVLRDNNKGLKDKIDEQSKEIEEAEQKEKKAYIDGTNVAHELCNKKWEDKIKAKIEEYDDKGMTIYIGNRSYGKTFQQVLKEELKKVLQSLLEKE